MGEGISFGQWLRDYGLEPFDVTLEEIAFGVIERKRLVASPELLANLIAIAREELGDSMGQAKGIAPSKHG